MRQLRTIRRSWRAAAAIVAVTVIVAGVASVVAASPGTPSDKASAVNDAITLVFAGQVVTDSGLEPFVDPYPPIEGGAARQYTVPDGRRLVIESMYADVFERYVAESPEQPATAPRSGITVGISTAYPNPECPFPGYERGYGIPLTAPTIGSYGTETELVRNGNVSGPILVEGARVIGGTAFAPNGDSTVYVKIIVHGHLEPATNPAPPVFDCS